MLSDACQRRNLESWLGVFGWVGAGWWVRGLLLGASFFNIILRIAVNVKRCSSANKPCMVGVWVQGGGWVSGLLGASFYHHQHHPPPTFPC